MRPKAACEAQYQAMQKPKPNRGRPPSREVAARERQIAELGKAGLTRREIAEEVDVCYETVGKVLSKLGVVVRRQAYRRHPMRQATRDRLDAQLAVLVTRRLTRRRIAERLRMNYQTLCGHLYRLGLQVAHAQGVISDSDRVSIVKRLREGISYAKLAERYGVTHQAIQSIAKKNGIRRRG